MADKIKKFPLTIAERFTIIFKNAFLYDTKNWHFFQAGKERILVFCIENFVDNCYNTRCSSKIFKNGELK